MTNLTYQALHPHIWRFLRSSLLIISLSFLASCGSKQTDVVDIPLSSGVASSLKSANFGQPASESEVKAMSDKLSSYFKGQHANDSKALIGDLSKTNYLPVFTPMVAASNVAKPVFRFYNTKTGTHFYTMSAGERDYVVNTFPFFNFEGNSFFAYPDTDATLSPVYRFYNQISGTHFFTISSEERDYVIATWPTIFNYEGISWYASPMPRTAWVPVYRFFNTKTGTHFYTTSAAERDHVLATWSWFTFEGIAYYVKASLNPDPIVTKITPLVAPLNAATMFTITGTNLPLTATLNIQDANCINSQYNTATSFSQTCIPISSGGFKNITVKDEVNGFLLDSTYAVNFQSAPVLNDTGVNSNQCYGAGSDVLISCTSAAAIALNSKQDGMTGRDVSVNNSADGALGFSYSTIGAYPLTDCVKDNVTGLIWEGKPTTGFRASNLTYTNLGNGAVNDASAYVAAVNASGLCGFNDWRLPSIDELLSLVFQQAKVTFIGPHIPTIDSIWFQNTSANRYITSTASAYNNFSYWCAFFDTGTNNPSCNRNTPSALRLVR